jgi:cytochrome P450
VAIQDDFEGAYFWATVPAKLDDPYHDFSYFRENKPIYYHEALGQWFVFRYQDVQSLFSAPQLSADRLAGMRQATPEVARPELDKIASYFNSWVLMSDGEKHKRIRHFLHQGFDAKVVQGLRDKIQKSADDLLDQAVSRGGFDVCEDYAFLLTAYVLADFLGVHPSDREKVVRWSMDFIDYFNVAPITQANTVKMVASGLELINYTRALLNERRLQPADDFLGTMIKLELGGGGLAEDELVSNAMLLLLAGHIAVRNFIGNAVWLFFQHPEEFRKLRAAPDLMHQAVEETLRFESPVAAIPRIPIEDFAFQGVTFKAGQIVQLVISSANRDPRAFTDPDRFDISRRPSPIVSFGHGPHTCLGAHLAREETRIALESLYRRMPTLALDRTRPITWYRNLGNRGPVNLPVVF